jgi:hypothetical protein
MSSLICCHLSSLCLSHHCMCRLFDLSCNAMCGLFIHPILTHSCYIHLITTYQMFWCIHMSLFYSKIFHLKTQTQTYSCNIRSLSYCHLSRLYLSFTCMLEFRDLSCEAKCQFGIWCMWIAGCNICPPVVKIAYSLNVCLLMACKELWQCYVWIFLFKHGSLNM